MNDIQGLRIALTGVFMLLVLFTIVFVAIAEKLRTLILRVDTAVVKTFEIFDSRLTKLESGGVDVE